MTLTMTIDRPAGSPYSRFHWETAASSWSREAAPLASSMLRAHAPVGGGPGAGRLRESISYREELTPGQLLIIFYTTVSYARYVLDGTKPHVITPRNAKALRWIGNRGHGSTMFAMRVQHPGTKPNPFPEQAMTLVLPALSRLFAEAVKEAIEL